MFFSCRAAAYVHYHYYPFYLFELEQYLVKFLKFGGFLKVGGFLKFGGFESRRIGT